MWSCFGFLQMNPFLLENCVFVTELAHKHETGGIVTLKKKLTDKSWLTNGMDKEAIKINFQALNQKLNNFLGAFKAYMRWNSWAYKGLSIFLGAWREFSLFLSWIAIYFFLFNLQGSNYMASNRTHCIWLWLIRFIFKYCGEHVMISIQRRLILFLFYLKFVCTFT